MIRSDLIHSTNKAKHEAARRRVFALGRDLGIACRILNGEVHSLQIVEDHGQAVAWTDFDKIYLNRALLTDDVRTDKDIAVWIGAAMHELGHTVFTWRQRSSLFAMLEAARSVQPNVHRTANLLEDQRQERFMVFRFPPTRAYFLATVTRVIIDKMTGPDLVARAFPLLVGRTWIPSHVRQATRMAFAKAHGELTAREVVDLVHRFQCLVDPAERQAHEAASIILRLDQVLSDTGTSGNGCQPRPKPIHEPAGDPIDGPDLPEPTEGDGEGTEGEGTDGEGTDGEGTDGEGTDGEGTEGEGTDGEGTDGEGTDGEGEGTDGEGTDGEGTKGDGEGTDGEGTDGEGTGTGKGEGESEDEGKGTGIGKGSGDTYSHDGPSTKDELREALEDALEDVLQAEDVSRDIAKAREAIASTDGAFERLPMADGQANNGTPSPLAMVTANEISEALGRIRDKAEPGHDHYVDSGRLNVPRMFGSQSPDPLTVFDRFVPDRLEETSVAFVLLVDLSSSMDSFAGDLSEAVWTIRQAADRADIDLTVIGFGDTAVKLWTSNDRPGHMVPVLRPFGGTSVTEALRAAFDVLRTSDASSKFAVTLSDGAWFDSDTADPVIHAMNDEGWNTASVFFTNRRSQMAVTPALVETYGHGAEWFTVISSLSDLPGLFRDMAERAMANVWMN